MCKVECPYCGKEFEVDYGEYWNELFVDDSFQYECPECEKIINLTPHISIDFDVEKCECQLENHEWQPTNTNPKAWTQMRCIHCGEEREPTEEEKVKYGIPSKEEYLESLRQQTKE